MNEFANRYGPWAVITGAARGIGKAFAQEIGSLGLDLVLIDILEADLTQTAAEIASLYSVKTKTIVADLADPAQIERTLKECKPYAVGLFCCNHAATHLFPDGKLRCWLDTSLESLQKMLQVNLSSSIELLYHFAQKMRLQKKGGVVLVSSGGALTGMPYLAQYSATKAFLANLGETLWWELKRDGIDVTTVLPGLTRTPGMLQFINSLGEKKIPMMLPKEVARITLARLGKQLRVIPGWRNILQAFLTTYVIPRKWAIFFFGKLFPQFFHILPSENSSSDLTLEKLKIKPLPRECYDDHRKNQ